MNIVQESYLDKQCIFAARALIHEAIQIKYSLPEHASLLHHPKLTQLIRKLEETIDYVISFEAGF